MMQTRVHSEWLPLRPPAAEPWAGRAAWMGSLAAVAVAVSLAAGPPLWVTVPLALGSGVGWVLVQPRLALAAAGARPLEDGDEPRLRNVIEGLASSSGPGMPRIVVVDDDQPNAFAGPGVIGLTVGVLRASTRTEIEAVVAASLVRAQGGAGRLAAEACAWGRLSGARIDDVHLDAHTVAWTRYPPALIAALSRMEPRSGRYAPFWLVADHRSRTDRDRRLEALSDL